MAHIRTHHPVSLYIADKSKPETSADRLVRLGWKSNEKTGRVAHSARCFSIPVWQPDLSGNDKAYLDILVEAVELRQNQMAHKYVTQMLELNNGVCNDIPAELLTPEAVLIQFNSEEASGDSSRGKLSGDQIGNWFNEKISGLFIEAVAEKKGWTAEGYQVSEKQLKELEQTANCYRATLQKLAAPTPKVDVSTAKQLRKAVELLGDGRKNDVIARKLETKLEAIINPPEEAKITLDLL